MEIHPSWIWSTIHNPSFATQNKRKFHQKSTTSLNVVDHPAGQITYPDSFAHSTNFGQP
jgi:hypothetical protein